MLAVVGRYIQAPLRAKGPDGAIDDERLDDQAFALPVRPRPGFSGFRRGQRRGDQTA